MSDTDQQQSSASHLPEPFTDYELNGAYDEMFEGDGVLRPQYRKLFDRLRTAAPEEIALKQQAADQYFLQQGVTFTVYSEARGVERIFPYDLLPRIVTAVEWQTISQGLAQRIQALNAFLYDIYHAGKILSDGVVPHTPHHASILRSACS